MTDHSRTGPSRREYIKYGGAVVGGGLLAGCSGDGTTDSSTTETESEPDTAEPTETASDAGHSVTMAPVGTVEFDSVPETWLPFTGDYADMGVALGQADGLEGIGVKARYATHHYDELPGVSVDRESLTQLYQQGTGKEVFYEVDADVHVIDPNFMVHRLGWTRDDVTEIGEQVAPFVGNTGFTRVYDWHDYEYYSLYDAFEKVADLFDERARYEAFAAYHDEVLADVHERLPAETPEVAVLYPAGLPPESFWPYLVGSGYQSKHWRDLRVEDALAAHGIGDAQTGAGKIDYETLLEVDPDVLAIRYQGQRSQAWIEENVLSHMRDHEVASELTAVQNDRVIYGGVTYQGPIIHLFQLERAAQGLYPEPFEGEQLFDRQRVADIVTGEG